MIKTMNIPSVSLCIVCEIRLKINPEMIPRIIAPMIVYNGDKIDVVTEKF